MPVDKFGQMPQMGDSSVKVEGASVAYINSNFVRKGQSINLGGNQKITNSADAVADSDLPNLGQVTALTDTKLSTAGGAMTGGINMQGQRIVGLPWPIHPDEAVRWSYLYYVVEQAGYANFLHNGTRPMTGDLNLNNHKVTQSADGTEGSDLVNLRQLTAMADSKLDKVVSEDFDMQGHKITNAADPTQAQDLVSKQYCDSKLSLNEDDVLDMRGRRIINLGNANGDDDVIGYNFCHRTFLPRIGGAIWGNLVFNNHRIMLLADPIAPDHGVNKQTLDARLRDAILCDGTTQPSADLDFNAQKITNLGPPTEDSDASTKAYTDTKLSIQNGVLDMQGCLLYTSPSPRDA